jgi:hypothetical protein
MIWILEMIEMDKCLDKLRGEHKRKQEIICLLDNTYMILAQHNRVLKIKKV